MNKKRTFVVIAAILLIFVLATGVFAFNPIYKILSLFNIEVAPKITAGNVYPEKVRPGGVLLLNISADDIYGISSATAKVYHESGYDLVRLALIEGSEKDGLYQGTWICHNAKNLKWYDIEIEIMNVKGKSSFTTLKYLDPTQTHPAEQITAGTFDAGDFTFQGNVTADSFYGDGAIPSGVIVMWSGSIANIPDGWALCDGTSGTPDLRDRFIVGAGDNYSVADIGGEVNHTLTINEMPSHTHSYSASDETQSVDGSGNSAAEIAVAKTSGSTGGDQAHENRPPYYALAYIMKL